MAIVKKELVQGLFVAFKKNFQDGLKTAEPDHLKIATVIPSNTAQNIYAWLGFFPKLREWVGKRIIKDMKEDGYAIVNKLYESTVGVPRTAIEDDTVGQYTPIMTQAGKSAARYPSELVFKLLKDGDKKTCYDGQNFFDKEHPVAENEDGTGEIRKVSNLLEPEAKTNDENSDHVFMHDEFLYGVRARGAAGFGYWQMCVKATCELNAENFEKARLMIAEFTGDGFIPLDFKADLLVVTPALQSAANKIVNSQMLAGGGDNPNYKATDLLVTPWLN